MAFSVSRITHAMLGRTFRSSPGEVADSSWRTAILEIDGPRPLTIAVSAERSVSAVMVAEMLGCEVGAVEQAMIDDALRELANMTAGQVVGELGLDQPLTLPRIVESQYAFGPDWHHYLLRSEDLVLVVSLVARLF